MTTTTRTCTEILSGSATPDTLITIKGWVKTRRDSKAGISFVSVSDGSCFHPVQVVVPNTLANYIDEVIKVTAGCAVEATGLIVPSLQAGTASPAMSRVSLLCRVQAGLWTDWR